MKIGDPQMGSDSITSLDVDTESLTPSAPTSPKTNRNKVVVGIALPLIIILLIVDSQTTKIIPDLVSSFLVWLTDNPVPGSFLMAGCYVIATVLFVPGSALTLGTGFALSNSFGLTTGLLISTLVVFIGASVGSIISFLIARYLLRSRFASMGEKYPIFKAVNKAMEKEGLKIMLLLRLSPLIPFNAINYIVGTTDMKLRDYVIAEVGMIPGIVLFCYVSSTLCCRRRRRRRGEKGWFLFACFFNSRFCSSSGSGVWLMMYCR